MKHGLWVIVVVVVGAGCAANSATPRWRAPTTAPFATTQPLDPKALVPLAGLTPPIEMPAVSPTTHPTQAPLDALDLYAQARDAQLQNRRNTAVNLLERALELDRDRFELNLELGRAYLAAGGTPDRALAVLQRAAELQPNSIAVQTDLGRILQSRGDVAGAIQRFRLAMLTDDYRDDDPLAGVVEYRLGVVLQQQGYSRAALDCYERLRQRLDFTSTVSRSTSPEIAYLLARPQSLYEEMGQLYEQLGDLERALESYQLIADTQPNEFEPGARTARLLVRLGRADAAAQRTAELVRHFRASSASISLLREVYHDLGREAALADTLRRLHTEHPRDRAILFALSDTLASAGKLDESRALLEQGIELHNGDVEIVQRLYQLLADRDRVTDAARMLLAVTSRYPETTSELAGLFEDLGLISRTNSLRLSALRKLEVPPDQEAAKQYFIWRMATNLTRPATARAALDGALAALPPFDPAYRAMLNLHLSRGDWDVATQDRASLSLIEQASARGRADLAAELRGQLDAARNRNDQAAEALSDAIALSKRPSPDLILQQAMVLLKQGNAPRFEQLMWKLIMDRPRFAPGYQILALYYRQNGASQRSWTVIHTWLANDPGSVEARLQQAGQLIDQRQGADALAILQKLFSQHPDQPAVVVSLVQLLKAAGQTSQAIELLERERTAQPSNRVIIEVLVGEYQTQQRMADATRVVDDARAAVKGDPDLLYYVAHLYQRIDQPQVAEQVMEEVLKLDPTHAEAGNDLGYTWADSGRNLPRAEALIRLAVKADPDNPAYLDSLAWVLYKRGRFEESRQLLEQASQPAESADPVILDHLGDVLYRLNRGADAQNAWKQALARIEQVTQREDVQNLRLTVQAKLKQSEISQPVNVAPVAISAPGQAGGK